MRVWGCVQGRHEAAAAASRSGRAGARPHPLCGRLRRRRSGDNSSAPEGSDARSLVEQARAGRQVAISPGFGELAAAVIRVDHTGQRARLDRRPRSSRSPRAQPRQLGSARGSVPAALEAAERAWALSPGPGAV